MNQELIINNKHYKKAETGVSNKLNAYYFGNRSVFRGALNTV